MQTENNTTPFGMQNLQMNGAPTSSQTPPPQPQAPQTPPPSSQAPQTPREHRSIGPIIGTLIIVIVLIIGALYVWGQKLNNEAKIQQTDDTTLPTGQQQTTNSPANTETDSASMSADLESSLNGIDDANF